LTRCKDPIYISELAEKVMNPNFRNLHFDSNHSQQLRLDELTVKFWAKSETMSNYCLLIDMTLSMRSLQFIAKTVRQSEQDSLHPSTTRLTSLISAVGLSPSLSAKLCRVSFD
jgi:hypothetical protein